ncbi:MAG: hypothetical protein OXP66_10385 [Candidatus Tectomicrobia bacterium]|nr:hypothetical protein [Candidatus Tectomicrobia bacterium]
MVKSRRVTFELPPASYGVLERAAQENGINVQAAASLILQAALARRVSGLVPKRPAKAGAGGGATAAGSSAPSAADPGSPEVPGTMPASGPPQGSDTV